MDKIERDIYVCRGTVPDPIEYPQWSNAIPLIFYMRDYTVPDDASVSLYMKKPSGAEIYNTGEISGNTITIPMTTQMSIESGKMRATVHIIRDDEVLNSFNIPIIVQPTAFSDSSIQSKDEFTALDQTVKDAEEAVDKANTAAANANSATARADTATEAAKEAAESANTAAQSVYTDKDFFLLLNEDHTLTLCHNEEDAEEVNSKIEQI